MKKLLVFVDRELDILQQKIINNIEKATQILDLEFIYYKPDDKLKHIMNNQDHRIYSDVLDYCEENDVDYLLFQMFLFPEYLVQELMLRENLKTKITIITVFSWWHKSEIRANVFKQIMDFDCVNKVLYLTNDVDDRIIPKFAECLENYNKLKPLPEHIKEEGLIDKYLAKGEKRDLYGFNESDIVLLYFGSAGFYGKGFDIFLEALELIDNKNIKFLLSINGNKNVSTIYNDLDKHKNVLVYSFGSFIEEEEMADLFAVSDCTVFSFRRTYEYGASSVIIQSLMANNPIIVPYFYPFYTPIINYNVGLPYIPEDPISLSNVINDLSLEKIQGLKKSKGRTEYLEKTPSFVDIVNEVIK